VIDLKSKRRPPTAPLSAMSDIGFLLLVFIMLISLINYRKEEKIEYPEALTVERTADIHELEIWITANGQFFVEGHNLTSFQLELLIAGAIVEHPDVRIHLLADRKTPYLYINEAVEVLQLLQHRVVSFVVKEDL